MKAAIKSKRARKPAVISAPPSQDEISGFDEPGVEIERYELAAAPAYNFSHHRRTFFKLLGSGILIAMRAVYSILESESAPPHLASHFRL